MKTSLIILLFLGIQLAVHGQSKEAEVREMAESSIEKETLISDLDTKISISEDTLDLDTVFVTDYPDLEFIHYFAYNKNKLITNKGDLKDFVKAVDAQLEEGRSNITITIYSSASQVPTKTYDTNETLTKIIAENMKYDLIIYFENREEFKGRVTVVTETTIVQGPEYIKDARNKEKYFPFQYVGMKTE